MTLQGKRLYILIAAAYLIGLWAMSIPLTGDQKVYLSVALEMRARSEWIIPYLYDLPNFLKPPLQYWATLLGWKIFGLSIFGALLPSAAALIGSAYLTNRLFDSRSGWAGLMFAGCLGSMTYGTTAQMEIWVVLFYLLSWLAWKQERYYRALIFVGVMAWIKGPLYPVLWVVSAVCEQLWLRKKLKATQVSALFLGAAIGLSWYALAATREWQQMRAIFFERENLGKLQTTQGTPWGLWAEFFYSLFPWFPLLILGLFQPDTRREWKNRRVFLLAFSLLPALFFTLFPYRVNTYLYLLTPVFAWMTSIVMGSEKSAKDRRAHLALSGYVVALSLGLAILAVRMAQGKWIGLELAIPILANLGLWSYFFARRYWLGFACVCLLLVNLIRMGAVQVGERDISGLRLYLKEDPTVHLGFWIQDHDIWHEFGLISAAIGQEVARVEESGLDAFMGRGGQLLLSEEQQQILSRQKPNMHCVSWPRLKRRMKFPFQRLLKEGLQVDDPEVLRFFFICKLDIKP